MVTFPPRDETLDALAVLDAYYRDRLGRPAETILHLDREAIAVWVSSEYQRRRVAGEAHAAALAAVQRDIDRAAGLSPATPPVPSSDRVLQPRSDFLGRWDRPLLMWGGMSLAERAEQLAWLAALGHHTVPLAVHNDYPRFPQWHWDWWDEPARLREALLELLAADVVPWLVLHPRPGRTMAMHLGRIATLWPHIHDVVPAIMWGWEINDLGGEWANGTQQLAYLDGLRRLVGDTPLWVHFTPERWAGWPGFDGQDQDRGEVEWLREAGGRGVVGMAYQEPPDKPEDQVLDRMLDIPSPHGWSSGICGRVTDGAGLRFVAFEFARDQARHARIVEALAADPRVSGWC